MPPPPKRKCTDSVTDTTNGTTAKTYTRSPDIYLDDGNIVLVAEDVAFRVHKSQLGRHSEVFRDMFSCVDQSGITNMETFDGCPLVRLSDTSNDVWVLLQAMYNGTQLDPRDIDLVITVLKMSTKYLIEPHRVSAFNVLRRIYPDTLAAWDDDREFYGLRHSHLVVQLPNMDILLPCAYYVLCADNTDTIFEHKLPLPVVERYCRGKDWLSVKFAEFVDQEIVGHGGGTKSCLDAWNCLEQESNILLRDPDTIKGADPLYVLSSLSEQDCVSDMCKECRLNLEDAVEKERKAIWESLPEVFGLGTWDELRKDI